MGRRKAPDSKESAGLAVVVLVARGPARRNRESSSANFDGLGRVYKVHWTKDPLFHWWGLAQCYLWGLSCAGEVEEWEH